MPSTFGLAVNEISTQLASAHVARDGQLVLKSGSVSLIGTLPANRVYRILALLNPGTPAESITAIFEATGVTGDTLTGVTAVEGTSDVGLAANYHLQIRGTAKYTSEIQAAVNALESVVPATAAQALSSGLNLVFCGDSFTAGWNLAVPSLQSYPALIGEILAQSITNRGVAGWNSNQITADLINNVTNPTTHCFHLCQGRNDQGSSISLATLQSNTTNAVAYFGSSRFLISTVLYQNTEIIGSPSRTYIADYNAWLLATWPNNTVDIATLILNYYDPTSSQDVADVANGVTPTSLRQPGDFEHPNAAGAAAWALEVLKKLSAWAPTGSTFLNNQSLAFLLGQLASHGSMHRGNDWRGPQYLWDTLTTVGTATHLNTVWVNGSDIGLFVDGASLKRFGIAQFTGFDPGPVRSTGSTANFFKSSNSTDASDPSATHTAELEWSDGSFHTFGCQLQVDALGSDNAGFSVDGAGLRRYGIYYFDGFSPQHLRGTGTTINFAKSSNATNTGDGTATWTNELQWSDGLWEFLNSTAYVTATGSNNAGLAIDGSPFKRFGIYYFDGFSPQIIRGTGTTINFVKSSNATDTSDSTATLVNELEWSDGQFFFVNSSILCYQTTGAAGGLTVGLGGATMAGYLAATASLSFGTVSANSTATLTISLTGAVVGDGIIVSPPVYTAGIVFSGLCTSAGVVTVIAANVTTSPIAVPSGTFHVRDIQ